MMPPIFPDAAAASRCRNVQKCAECAVATVAYKIDSALEKLWPSRNSAVKISGGPKLTTKMRSRRQGNRGRTSWVPEEAARPGFFKLATGICEDANACMREHGHGLAQGPKRDVDWLKKTQCG
ncbi:unnamed protein product [Calypogeia fissa]